MGELSDFLKDFNKSVGIDIGGDPTPTEEEIKAPDSVPVEKTAEQIAEEKAREERKREAERKAAEEREKREKEIAGLQRVSKIKSEWESRKTEIQEELKDFTGLKKLLNRKKYNELTAENAEIEENLEKLRRSLKAKFGNTDIPSIMRELERPRKSLDEMLNWSAKLVQQQKNRKK